MLSLVYQSNGEAPSSLKSSGSHSPVRGVALNTVTAVLQSDSSKSIVMKLVVNYMQVITIVGNFKIKWSSSVRSMFGFTNILSSGGSLENAGFALSGGQKCFMYNEEMPLPMSELLVYVELFIINAIVIGVFWILYFSCCSMCSKKPVGGDGASNSSRSEAITVSLLVLAYNSYPKFIRGFFQLFSCTRW